MPSFVIRVPGQKYFAGSSPNMGTPRSGVPLYCGHMGRLQSTKGVSPALSWRLGSPPAPNVGSSRHSCKDGRSESHTVEIPENALRPKNIEPEEVQ